MWIGYGMGWDWDGLDLCAGLLYEHRFAMLIIKITTIFIKIMKIITIFIRPWLFQRRACVDQCEIYSGDNRRVMMMISIIMMIILIITMIILVMLMPILIITIMMMIMVLILTSTVDIVPLSN